MCTRAVVRHDPIAALHLLAAGLDVGFRQHWMTRSVTKPTGRESCALRLYGSIQNAQPHAPVRWITGLPFQIFRCGAPLVASWIGRSLSLVASAGLPQSAVQYRGDAIRCLVHGMPRVRRDSTWHGEAVEMMNRYRPENLAERCIVGGASCSPSSITHWEVALLSLSTVTGPVTWVIQQCVAK